MQKSHNALTAETVSYIFENTYSGVTAAHVQELMLDVIDTMFQNPNGQYWTSGATGAFSIQAKNDSAVTATGDYAVAEGFDTLASGYASHAEGEGTIAGGFFGGDHAEGSYTNANGGASHAEGSSTQANGINSHAEGGGSIANGPTSHAEGTQTIAAGNSSHAEGYTTQAIGDNSHSEGFNSISSGFTSHAEGSYTQANFDYSHAEGNQTKANNYSAHAEGSGSYANGQFSHAEGGETVANANGAHSEGSYTQANGDSSHAEGNTTRADGQNSHAQGYNNQAGGKNSFAGGDTSIAGGENSFVHGDNSNVLGKNSAAFGHLNTAIGDNGFITGELNCIPSTVTNAAILGGMGITATTKSTTYVPYFCITQADDNTDDSLNVLVRQSDGTINKRPITGLPFTYTTGLTFDNTTYILTGHINDGGSYTANLAILASDVTITGGTYNNSTGVATFANSSGGTFQVSGFTTGMTDTYTTGATYNNTTGTITFGKNNGGTYNVSGLYTGYTDNDNYLAVSGGTVTGDTIFAGLTANTISATTYQNLPAFNSPYQILRNGGGSLPAANGDGTYYLTIGGNSLATCVSGTGNAFVPANIYIASADYPTINGKTPKLRVRATIMANNQSFSGSTTFGLYPMGSSGGAIGAKVHTLGAVISGSTVSGSTYGNNAYTVQTGSDFALPADGWYCVAFAKVGTIPSPNGFVEFQADLQLHYS